MRTIVRWHRGRPEALQEQQSIVDSAHPGNDRDPGADGSTANWPSASWTCAKPPPSNGCAGWGHNGGSNSPVIGRGLLMARLREAHENHDWRWEGERRQSCSGGLSPSKHNVAGNRSCLWMPLFKNRWRNCERWDCPGRSSSRRTARHPLQRLGRSPAPTRPARQSTDTDYESLRALIEAPVPRRSPASEAKAANREMIQLA